MSKAFGVGIVSLLIADALWLFLAHQASLFMSVAEVGAILLWCSPVAAAFLVVASVPRYKVYIATTMAILTSLFMAVANFAFEAFGHVVDFPGVGGATLVMGMSLPLITLLCLIGGIAGYALTKRENNA